MHPLPPQELLCHLCHHEQRRGNQSNQGQLLVEMKKKGLTPDKVTFNSVINGFCLERNIRAAQNVLCDILEKGLVPDMVTYSTLIDGYCKGGNMQGINFQLST
ncbi:hypothetical protein SUGI_0813740 [Cryptomeria japonica]|nr:hypothetical protein SUGI_0813740 [Cryptomeria japonica]